MLSKELSQLLTASRLLGQSTAIPINLSDCELSRIIAVILKDLGNKNLIPPEHNAVNDYGDYYSMPIEFLTSEVPTSIAVEGLLQKCSDEILDFLTYFRCICEIHKRRLKYTKILSSQPLPTMDQVAPRSLLEFGIVDTPALASWLTWRKWLYDIDNRSAQETGYLFEPILASALGGISYGARNSPVKRKDAPAKGRQVDCIVGNDAYEFKMRVTIAASGQGRFAEELAFAEDCQNSGFRPILVVLDPTPSDRLSDYKSAFEAVGGTFFIGDDAWKHLEEKAGKTMANFIDNYVRGPILDMHKQEGALFDLKLQLLEDDGILNVTLGSDKQNHEWKIQRETQ